MYCQGLFERQWFCDVTEFWRLVFSFNKILLIPDPGLNGIFSGIRNFWKESGADSVMIARAAEWNPSVFSPKGKVNIYEIVDKYLDYAIQYDQPFILSKYNIQQHLGGDQVIFEMSLVFCLNLSDCWLKLEILQNDMNNFGLIG